MADTRCFLLIPTGRTYRGLRRYASREDAPKCATGYAYHNAEVAFDVVEQDINSDVAMREGEPPRDDPRWPVKCEQCDYAFTDRDAWQLWREREMQRSDTGELTTLSRAPAGAMWWADWMENHSPKHGARGGGPHLLLKTPGGDWDIDAKSANGDGWDRTGEPPNVTARPSIGIYHHDGKPGWKYHAFLTDGVLSEC